MTKFPLLAILLFIAASAFAQTNTEKEVKNLLAHKWKATHMEKGGQKTPLPAEAGDWYLDLKADGTLIMLDSEGQKKGKWSYNHKTKTLTTTTDLDPWNFQVVKVNATELILKATEDGVTTTGYMKRVN